MHPQLAVDDVPMVVAPVVRGHLLAGELVIDDVEYDDVPIGKNSGRQVIVTFVGWLDAGERLEVLIDAGEHRIRARARLSVSPVHRFMADHSPVELERGCNGSPHVVRFGAGLTMSSVRFSDASAADDEDQ